MSDRIRPLGGHLRRHAALYAVGIFAFSFSPVPSMAADLVTTEDIANGAVTAPKLASDSVNGAKVANESITNLDIRNGAVTEADLNDSAEGAKVIRYNLGSHNFATNGALVVNLPGTWSSAIVGKSSWSATMRWAGGTDNVVIPGGGLWGNTRYDLTVWDNGTAIISARTGDPGESYSNIRLFQTEATSTVNVP